MSTGIEKYARVTPRLILMAVLFLLTGAMFNFYDFFIIGFINTFISKPWHLTVAEATWLIAASGVGLVIGGFVIGYIADLIGRKNALIISTLIYSLFSIISAFVPKGAWQLLTIYRFFIGFGVGAAFTVVFPYIAEYAPRNIRGLLTGFVVIGTPIGTLIASLSSAYLVHYIGWRGLLLEGGIPLIFVPVIYFGAGESYRWLINKGKINEAINNIARIYGIPSNNIDLNDIKEVAKRIEKKTRFIELFKYRRALATSWTISFMQQLVSYNFTIWGPAILVFVMGVSPHIASFLFIFVSISGILGRITYDLLLDRIGRRLAGFLTSPIAAIMLILAGIFHSVVVSSISIFYVLALIGYFFLDAAWPILTTYGSEVWPQEVRASGWGSAYGFGGIGKIIGSIAIGLLLGEGLTISPKPKLPGTVPVFLLLGIAMLIAFIAWIFAIEAKGKSLEEIQSR